jgi:hypothetical protein
MFIVSYLYYYRFKPSPNSNLNTGLNQSCYDLNLVEVQRSGFRMAVTNLFPARFLNGTS